ncbi:Protein natd1 [Halocaridina rubra]|uniref:Protein NATD1 n=1 Tax=Halocaridina rubra TaxID=373956 RepID=A0AAN9A963_HALRR
MSAGRYTTRSMSQGLRAASGIRLKSGEVPEGMQVHHDQENKEFYIKLGNEKAFLQYDIIDEEAGSVDLQHTVVPDAYRGQGIAKVLAKEVMSQFAAQNKNMRLTCWYLKKYYKENPSPLYLGQGVKLSLLLFLRNSAEYRASKPSHRMQDPLKYLKVIFVIGS